MARYALTAFLSAFLLFQVQPLIAKSILPWFGGGSSVWTTCMLFFQVLLLGGYTYAHLLSVKLSLRRQGLVHLLLVIVSLALLPITPSQQLKPTGGDSPVGGILLLLLATVGGPYFVLSSTGPLMQRWFSRLFAGRSPYRLYALSNVGSLLALLSYPFLVEPVLRLHEQVWIWSVMYAVFAALAVWCAIQVMHLDEEPLAGPTPTAETEFNDARTIARPGLGRMLLWLGLAAMGSTMLLATTNQMCIDVAVVPFLWVLPLGLYLLSFVICFDNPRWYDRRVFGLLLVLAAAAACWQLNQELDTSIPGLVCIYSVVMFACCMTCHGELVQLRPDPRHLTLFYLLVSAGGAFGGVFVAVVSPAVFTGFWEYHFALAGACGVTLIAWYVARPRQGGASLVVWAGALISAIQVWLVIELVYRKQAESFTQGDASLLFGVIGVMHLIGWAVTADRERSPRTVTVVWTAVTIGQLAWVIGLNQTRFAGSITISQYAVLGVSSIVVASLGLLVTWTIEKRMSEATIRWILIAGLQVLLAAGVFWLQHNGTISTATCGKLLGGYLGLYVLGQWLSRRKSVPFVECRAWFLAPTATAWGLLVMALHHLTIEDSSDFIYKSRNFYGVLSVAVYDDVNGEYHSLMHGQIEHGNQYTDDYWKTQPTTYYGQGSGVDLAISLHPRRRAADTLEKSLHVGIVGLGAGTIAAYGNLGDTFRFYEINRDVIDISDQYFSYRSDSPATTEVVMGDARINLDRELAKGGSQQFDVLAVDAFSSDAIPLHLLTRECADLFRRHLKDDGLLLLHISNRYLDLNPITLALADHLGWKAVRIDADDDDELGIYGSTWIIITANEEFLAESEVQRTHSPWDEDQAKLLWTDDYASLWQVISY